MIVSNHQDIRLVEAAVVGRLTLTYFRLVSKMFTNVAKQVLAVFVLFIGLISAEKCLPGKYHKKTSSPATEEYAECKAWSSDTCCTANFTKTLNKTRARELYGFHYGHCKNISKVSKQSFDDNDVQIVTATLVSCCNYAWVIVISAHVQLSQNSNVKKFVYTRH